MVLKHFRTDAPALHILCLEHCLWVPHFQEHFHVILIEHAYACWAANQPTIIWAKYCLLAFIAKGCNLSTEYLGSGEFLDHLSSGALLSSVRRFLVCWLGKCLLHRKSRVR
ncbi:hypothetical protein WAI453_004431 [Rhynchosporium graminicola]